MAEPGPLLDSRQPSHLDDPGLDPDRPDPDGVIRIVEAAPGPQVEALLVER
jgi:hypothetical protein